MKTVQDKTKSQRHDVVPRSLHHQAPSLVLEGCPVTHRGRRSRRSDLCPADQRWTCLSHSSDSSKFHSGCQGSHRECDGTLSSNGTVPGLARPLQGATVPTNPSKKSHHHREDFTLQCFTLKGTPLLNGPFSLVNRRYKNTKSLSGCLPARKSPDTDFEDSEGI